MSDKKQEREEKKRRKAENKKKPFVDDGHTVADMNVEGLPWYEKNRPDKEKKDRDKPTKKELFAMIMGAYKAYLPMFLISVGVFTVVFLIFFLLLHFPVQIADADCVSHFFLKCL